MDILDRYLQAVKKHLPWYRQDDIIAELRANLESQLDDREEEIGRPLSPTELEAWLRELGPPMQMAARYQPQQYLIGPSVFPTYWYVMRLATFWVLVIYVLVNAVLITLGDSGPNADSILGAILRLPFVLMTTAAWITLIFAALEFFVTHYPEKFTQFTGAPANWAPGALPAIEKAFDHGSGKKKPRTYAHALAEFVFSYIGLIWLILVPKFPILMFGPGAFYLRTSPFQFPNVWMQFYWCILALNVVQTLWRSIDIWRGTWQQERPVRAMLFKAFGLLPLSLLIAAPGQILFSLKHPEIDQAQYGATVDSINHAVHKGLMAVCAIVLIQLVWDIVQMNMASYRRRMAAM